MAITAAGASSLLLSCLSWLLLGWLFAVVSQMTSASALLQPLSDADKEAVAAYFLADANGFYGRSSECWEGYIAVQPWDHNQSKLNDEESHYDNIRYTELTALVNNLV
ncbi:unnamed protein product [Sphagnum tenellum]